MSTTFVEVSNIIISVGEHFLKKICVIIVNTLFCKMFLLIARMTNMFAGTHTHFETVSIDLWILSYLSIQLRCF